MSEKYNIPEPNSLDSMEGIESEKDFVPILNKERFNRSPVFSKEVLDIIASDPMWIDNDNKTKTIAEKTKGAVKVNDISIHPLFPRLKLGSMMYNNNYYFHYKKNRDFIQFLKDDREFTEEEKESIAWHMGPIGHGLAGVEELVNHCDENSSFIDVSVYENYKDSLILNFLDRFSGIIWITKGYIVRGLDFSGKEKINVPDNFKIMIVNIFEKHFENVSRFINMLAKNSEFNIAELEKEFRNYIEDDRDILSFPDLYETLSIRHYADEERKWRTDQQEWMARLDILQKTEHFVDTLNRFLLIKLKT